MPKPVIQLPPQTAGSGANTFSGDQNLVIIGANGTGKSRLGAWIEQHTPQTQIVHRISAQRALDVPEFAPMKTMEQSMNEVLFGHADSRYASNNFKAGHRWGNKLTTHLQNDYDKVLSLLFAKTNKRDSEYISATRAASSSGNSNALPIPQSPVDRLKELWADVFPHRVLTVDDGKITAKLPGGSDYKASEMSDGERVVIYLMAQCLCIPDGTVIIVDEPEIHLHRSIMKRLWDAIERARPDCLFVHITHDLDFAASRTGAFKIWVRAFNGNDQWEWQEAPYIEGFPEALQLELLGTRKPILCVEGERGSLDELIYSAVYPDWFIVPRGGCSKVIESVRGLSDNSPLHSLKIAGIIDRDFRSEHELTTIVRDSIHVLAVAEIENLLCIEEFIHAVSESLARDFNGDIVRAKAFIIEEFKKETGDQVAKMTASEVHFRLGRFDRNQSKLADIQTAIIATTTAVDAAGIHSAFLARANEAVTNSDFNDILRMYNRKGLHKRIGSHIFRFQGNEYHDLVLRLLKSSKRDFMVTGLRRFCPTVTA